MYKFERFVVYLHSNLFTLIPLNTYNLGQPVSFTLLLLNYLLLICSQFKNNSQGSKYWQNKALKFFPNLCLRLTLFNFYSKFQNICTDVVHKTVHLCRILLRDKIDVFISWLLHCPFLTTFFTKTLVQELNYYFFTFFPIFSLLSAQF